MLKPSVSRLGGRVCSTQASTAGCAAHGQVTQDWAEEESRYGEKQPGKAGFEGGRNHKANPRTSGIRALGELALERGMKSMEGGLQVFFLVTELNCSLKGGCLFSEGRKVQ